MIHDYRSRLAEKAIQLSPDIIYMLDQDGKFLAGNASFLSMLGYTQEELSGKCLFDLMHPSCRDKSYAAVQAVVKGTPSATFESNCVHKDGHLVRVAWSVSWCEEDRTVLGIGRNVTELFQARQELLKKDEFYRALVENGADMFGLLDEQGSFLYTGGAVTKLLGYHPAELIGQNAFGLMHPDDLPEVLAQWNTLEKEERAQASDFRFRAANGEWRWLEAAATNHMHNPCLQAYVYSAREITERKQSNLRLEESEQRFRSLFENNPDIILRENNEGYVEDVNKAFAATFGVQQEEVVYQHVSSLVPASVVPLCEQWFGEALAGKTVKFDFEQEIEGKGLVQFDGTKVPVWINGEVRGVYTILKDITAIKKAHEAVRQQAKKLNTVFESITDAFFMLDKSWGFSYMNSEAERLFRRSKQEVIGKSMWELFPAKVGGDFYRHYHEAIETGKAVRFEAYYAPYDVWVEVKAFPSEEGLSVYFTDVTERVKTGEELKKLSQVASKTTNGVIITDKDRRIEWVNEGFTRLTGYSFEEAVGWRPSELLHKHGTDQKVFTAVEEKLKKGEHSSFEILNYKKNGDEVWFSVKVSPILNEEGELVKFITTQTDITDLKKSELELAKLARDLYGQNRDLQQFTYIVSHNLRAPVANILGLSSLLTRLNSGEEAFEKSLGSLKTSAQRLDTVLKDLNMILSIRDNQDTVPKEEVKLSEVCQQVVAYLEDPLRECKGIVALDVAECCSIWTKKAYLHSILYNLLSNAIKYRAEDRPLRVSIKCVSCPTKGTEISFSDNGSGMDMNKVGNDLFKLYKRFHKDREGRGIGLYLVKTQVSALDGTIEVSSRPNIGTEFVINLK
ncbi:PAS domain S-box-containing protein [Pontibacter ummariensis]|uniref:histidine kinase n=1 Tax=Pontibacter ummariensis TaxID=1610492 RepID=A0A239ERE1_9BACT|nr:PAS domain S-box protein [Pontibacter ummariensis]PRY12810.1 PAS domain S-box-containing protein [Pontibacter ummariensis]SNS46613.1 PAS domain S-box-containing protein [Pontibacter ummariensis]